MSRQLADKELSEVALLQRYLPPQLSEEAINEHLIKIIAELPAQSNPNAQLGQVIKKFYQGVDKASVQGETVSRRAKELLSS
jgi:uncharacterized protein YqeY